MSKPELWIIAGPNGAGKTTLVLKARHQFALPEQAFINPDAITLMYLKEQGIGTWADAPSDTLEATFIRAANDAERLLHERIESGGTAVIESVLSTQKYCRLVERVLELGGTFSLIYVALQSPEVSRQRVTIRKAKGGHGVPEDKLEARWKRSLELLPWFAVKATEFWLIDNTAPEEITGGHLLVSGAKRVLHVHGIPNLEMRPLVSAFLTGFTSQPEAAGWRFDLEDRFELATA